MKVLLYDWVTSVGNKKLPQEMERRGYIVKRFQKDIKDYFYDEEFEKELLKEIEDVDVVFGFNFFPLIARTCYSRNKKYISWCFDCPLFQLFSKETEYETNFIFVFDLEQFKECELIGIKNVYYLPLAANIICDEIKKPLDYQCDVSFVGRLYDDNLYRSIQYLPDHLKGYLKGIMSAQKLIYGADILEELLVPKYMNEIKNT